MKNKNLIFVLMAFVMILMATLACGSDNSGTVVGTSSSNNTVPVPTVSIYKVGDVIKVGDQTITLNSAELRGNLASANFTIENNGSTDIMVSSMLNFTAKDSDGIQLKQNLFDCGTSSLDGKLLPGDKLKGDICWKRLNQSNVKIYYEAQLFGSGAIVWEVSK